MERQDAIVACEEMHKNGALKFIASQALLTAIIEEAGGEDHRITIGRFVPKDYGGRVLENVQLDQNPTALITISNSTSELVNEFLKRKIPQFQWIASKK